MRRTDFCRLTSSYEHPRLVGFRSHRELSLVRDGRIACHHVRAIRFGGPHVPALWLHRGGRCLPIAMRVGRASDTPVASPSRSTPLARRCSVVEAAETERQAPRVMRGRVEGRPEVPSIGQGLLPRDALSGARLEPRSGGAAWPPHVPVVDAFSPARAASRRMTHARARPPSTRPVASGGHASLGLGLACRLLQPVTTRGHTRRAFDPRTRVELLAPLLAGTNRCRLRRPPRCVAASWGLRATACTRRLSHDAFHLRGQGRPRAEALEQGVTRGISGGDSRVPSSWRFGHPGRRTDWRRGLGAPRCRSRRPRSIAR